MCFSIEAAIHVVLRIAIHVVLIVSFGAGFFLEVLYFNIYYQLLYLIVEVVS